MSIFMDLGCFVSFLVLAFESFIGNRKQLLEGQKLGLLLRDPLILGSRCVECFFLVVFETCIVTLFYCSCWTTGSRGQSCSC